MKNNYAWKKDGRGMDKRCICRSSPLAKMQNSRLNPEMRNGRKGKKNTYSDGVSQMIQRQDKKLKKRKKEKKGDCVNVHAVRETK
jgi:hypothetical protein